MADDWPYDEDPDKVTLFCHPDDEAKLRAGIEMLEGLEAKVTVRASGAIEEPGTAYWVNHSVFLRKKIDWEPDSFIAMPTLDPFSPFGGF